MKIIEVNLPHSGSYSRRGMTDELVLHHAEASRASVEEINRWHNARGWNGVGYHYYIRKDGSVYRGRPEWAVGAHAVNHNSRSIGICCEGAYMTETMPKAQLESLLSLIRDVQGRYDNKLALRRHRDVGSTDCPGNNFPWVEAQRWNETEKGEPELTEEQVRKIVRSEISAYEAEQAGKSPSAWASAAWEKATEVGITDGTMPQSAMTREMGVVMMQRAGLIGK